MPGGPAVLRFTRGLPPTKQFGERLRLLVRQGQDQGTCYSLLGDLVFIGREDCQINLHDSNISRKHAEIAWKGDHYVIRDLGSANGIIYNGTKTGETKLGPGDIVMMGLTVFEVYPSGQTRKNEKPMLAAPIKRLSAVPAEAGVAAAAPPIGSKEEREERRKVEKKRMMIIVVLFFLLASAYFTDEQVTMRERAKIQQAEDVETPAEKQGKPADESAAEIARRTKAIQEMKMKLVNLQAKKAEYEQQAKIT